MIIRALDDDGDFVFGKGRQSYLNGQNAVALNIKTRLKMFKYDCFWDMINVWVDWLGLMRQKNTGNQIALSCRSVILKSFGVTRLNQISASVVNRKLSIKYNCNSTFSVQNNQQVEVLSV